MIEMQTHTIGTGGRRYPAVNVKVRDYPSAGAIMDALDCSREQAEQALQYAFRSAQETFWHEDAPRIAEKTFGEGVEVYSAGRSGGWLIVDGLSRPDSWGEEMLENWEQFRDRIRKEVSHLSSKDYTVDMIKANRWHEPGAEQYNFVDRDGQTLCLSELKRQAREDGYGPVIRS